VSKKIAFLLPTLGAGGAERTTIRLAGQLAREGQSIFLVVFTDRGDLKPEVDPAVVLVNLATQRARHSVKALAHWLRDARPEVVVATQSRTNLVAWFARSWSRTSCQLVLREVSTVTQNLKALGWFRGLVLKWAMRLIYPRCDSIVAVSQGVADDMQAYIGRKLSDLSVIYDPVLDAHVNKQACEPVGKGWFSDSNIKVFLAVGRLTAAKNYHLLLDGFSQVVADHPAARLLILGEGELREVLERRIVELGLQELVSMPGFDPNPYKYMSRCHAYVMSSSWEGLPGALIQALALAPVVISTDCPSGPREVLGGGRFGQLVANGNQQALGEAMVATLDNVAKSERTAALENHLQQFTTVASLQCYRRLLGLTVA
jgi:glycosyltransferase involved in cell wall biosynthesis